MTWTTPIDPPSDGSAITRAFFITYVKDDLAHLRTVTGGDPVSAGQVLVATGAGAAAWTTALSGVTSLLVSGGITGNSNLAILGNGSIIGTLAVGGATVFSASITGTSAAFSAGVSGTTFSGTTFSATDASGFIFTSAEGGGTDAFYESGSHTPAVKVSNVQIQRWLAGTTVITAATQITGQVTITGSGTYTGTWAAASDQRLKTQVAAVTDGLAKVMQLKPITYRQSALYRRLYGNREDSNRRYQGFIAQDVAQVFPDVVVENQDDNGMLAVDYGRLVVALTAALQELAARVVALEAAP